MAFCIECGSKLPDNAKFCLECGTAVAKLDTTKKEDSSPTLKLNFGEQETPKYKEETESKEETTQATPVITSAEEEYFDDDETIELFEEEEEKKEAEPISDLMDMEDDLLEDESLHSAIEESDDREQGDYIAEQAKKYFEGLSAAQDYAYEQGMDSSNITEETVAPILNPITDPYFDDILPELDEELNKADKTLLIKPALIITLILLAVIWFVYML